MTFPSCYPELYKAKGASKHHRSCATNIAEVMRPYGMNSYLEVTDPFNICVYPSCQQAASADHYVDSPKHSQLHPQTNWHKQTGRLHSVRGSDGLRLCCELLSLWYVFIDARDFWMSD